MTRPGQAAGGRLDTSSIFAFEFFYFCNSVPFNLLPRLDRALSTAGNLLTKKACGLDCSLPLLLA